jgi:hypothetical protein
MPDFEVSSKSEEKILAEAIHSPSVAMMRLSIEIDRQLRLILAVVGRLREYSGRAPTEALDLIAKSAAKDSIPPSLREILNEFWSLRNEIVHGRNAHEGFAMRTVDYGLRILRMLQSIPRPAFIVVKTVVVFSDNTCSIARSDVGGVILDHLGPNEQDFGHHIHPTRRSYVEGQSVSWEWNLGGEGWGESWYRDPRSGEIKYAWTSSLEFIGRPLEEI